MLLWIADCADTRYDNDARDDQPEQALHAALPLWPSRWFASRQRTDGPLWPYKRGVSWGRTGLASYFLPSPHSIASTTEPTARQVKRLRPVTECLAALVAEACRRAKLTEALLRWSEERCVHSDAQRLT